MQSGPICSEDISATGRLDAPILLRLFRRPDETRLLLRALGEMRPNRVFVWIDAPRNEHEIALVDEVKALVRDLVVWECELKVYENSVNRGMTNAFRASCDWFFDEVEFGVVVEDDCIPGLDFLEFCTELLIRFKDDHRVLAITGDNATGAQPIGKDSYFFVNDFSVWGWASWRRVWQAYDHDIGDWPALRADRRRLRRYWPNRVQRKIWVEKFDRLYSNLESLQESTWRYLMLGLKLEASVIVPRVNLVTNVGTDFSVATGGARSLRRAHKPTSPILPLRHPRKVRVSRSANRTLFFSPLRNNRQRLLAFRLKKRFRRIMKKVFAAIAEVRR